MHGLSVQSASGASRKDLHRVATLFHPGLLIAVIAIVAGFTLLNRRRG